MVQPVRLRPGYRAKKAVFGTLVAFCSLAAPLVASASTSGRIVVNTSIDGVKLGATQSSVKKLLGRPQSTARCSVLGICLPGVIPGVVSWTYGSPPRNTSYVFFKGQVALMATFSTSERTAAGVGPGTSFKVAKQRYPQLAFHPQTSGGPPNGYYITALPTKTGDDFTMMVVARRKVDWLEIGRWNSSPKYACAFSICS